MLCRYLHENIQVSWFWLGKLTVKDMTWRELMELCDNHVLNVNPSNPHGSAHHGTT